jgi:hypothetical protein
MIFLERVDGRYADATGVVMTRNLCDFKAFLIDVDTLGTS